MHDYPDFPVEIELKKLDNSDEYLLRINGNALYVSPLIGTILNEMKFRKSPTDIMHTINNKCIFNKNITLAEVKYIIDEKIHGGLINKYANIHSNPHKDIAFRIVIAKSENISGILNYAGKLFDTKFFYILFLLTLTASIAFSLFIGAGNLPYSSFNFKTYFLTGIFLFLIGLIHEIGHASAAQYFKIKAGEIGAGLYLIFPVFYADVTNVWSLNPRQRVVVNLGGIYFQQITNSLLILAFLIADSGYLKDILQTWVLSSTGLILINLIPFLKFDGYWIYSDFFDIKNLRQSTYIWAAGFFAHITKGKSLQMAKPALKFYACGSFVFGTFIIAIITKFLIESIFEIPAMFYLFSSFDFKGENWVLLFGMVFKIFISALFLVRFAKSIFFFLKNR